MKNFRAWAASAGVAILLAAGGLGYAHFREENIFWIFRVAADSIWRVFAVSLTRPLINVGFLLLPISIAAMVFANAAGSRRRN